MKGSKLERSRDGESNQQPRKGMMQRADEQGEWVAVIGRAS